MTATKSENCYVRCCVMSTLYEKYNFFHGSAHARVFRKLICVPARSKANFSISEVLRGEVSEVDFILKNPSLYYTSVIRNRFVWIIFYSALGFSFILLFLHLSYLKVVTFKCDFLSQEQHE